MSGTMTMAEYEESDQWEKDLKQVDNAFSFHPATPENGEKHDEVREHCRFLARWIVSSHPPSRNRSLALTSLEEVMMRLNAAIATGA